jgi:hypothetical protein
LLTGWAAASSLLQGPHWLGYFHELAGGPRHGEAHLLHSNLDWGQDLVALNLWMQQHPEARPLRMAYCGLYDPHDWGLDCVPAPFGPVWTGAPLTREFVPGWYALSVSYLRGSNWMLTTPAVYEGFRELPAEAECGSSIRVYHIDTSQAARLTTQARAAPPAPARADRGEP